MIKALIEPEPLLTLPIIVRPTTYTISIVEREVEVPAIVAVSILRLQKNKMFSASMIPSAHHYIWYTIVDDQVIETTSSFGLVLLNKAESELVGLLHPIFMASSLNIQTLLRQFMFEVNAKWIINDREYDIPKYYIDTEPTKHDNFYYNPNIKHGDIQVIP